MGGLELRGPHNDEEGVGIRRKGVGPHPEDDDDDNDKEDVEKGHCEGETASRKISREEEISVWSGEGGEGDASTQQTACLCVTLIQSSLSAGRAKSNRRW